MTGVFPCTTSSSVSSTAPHPRHHCRNLTLKYQRRRGGVHTEEAKEEEENEQPPLVS